MIKLLGIPFDTHSSFMQGPALAPDRVRQALHNGAGNYWTEHTFNPIEHELFRDIGNLDFANYFDIKNKMAEVLADGSKVLTLGGDHSITYPVIQAYQAAFGEFEILQIDAHGDLYDHYNGNKYSHACPFARIMEEKLVCKLTQVGIRTFNRHQREQAARFEVQVIEAKDFAQQWTTLSFDKPLYISLDLDGLDPAFAPGVSHHEPGGLSTREVLNLIHHIDAPIIGADIVEYNPHRDLSDMTAALAAKFVKEIAGKMSFEF
ncbi:MAG: agmatinase [Bacteroidota bacterium]